MSKIIVLQAKIMSVVQNKMHKIYILSVTKSVALYFHRAQWGTELKY